MTGIGLLRIARSSQNNSAAPESLPHRIRVAFTRFEFSPILLVALALLGAAGNIMRADTITNTYGSGTSVMSWAYYNLLHVGKIGTYWTYYPFQPDYKNAVFQGYVSTPADGIWGPVYDPADDDAIFVFRTNVLSSVDQTISLTFGGDDNATAYVNGVFQDDSHIFTKGGHFDLSLQAGVPVSLEMAMYNGPDGWVLGLNQPNGQNLLGNDSTITIDAVPEPAGIFLMAAVLGGCAAFGYRRRGLTRSAGR